jgi:hypothetical protein
MMYFFNNLFRTRRVLFIALLVSPLFTQAAPSTSVVPLVIDADVEVRDIEEHIITLTNTGDVPVTIYPTVNNISLNEGGTIQEFLTPVESDQKTSLSSWIEISRAGIDLMAGDVKTVTLTLRINPNAVPGEYHAFVGFAHGGNRDEAERMVARGDAPGTVVRVKLEDDRVFLLKLSRFLVDRFVTDTENEAATYVIKNPGDESLIPHGEVIFYDSRGVEIASTPVNPDKEIIGPGEEKVFVSGVPTDGMFGKYKAFLNVEYGVQNLASIQDTTFFYVFPLRTLLMMLGGLILVVLVLSLYVHRKYFDEVVDDGSELLPVHVRDSVSDPLHHDIDLRQR